MSKNPLLEEFIERVKKVASSVICNKYNKEFHQEIEKCIKANTFTLKEIFEKFGNEILFTRDFIIGELTEEEKKGFEADYIARIGEQIVLIKEK